MNAQSSRSHSVFTINLKVKKENSEGFPVQLQSKLHVIDLAGSQRQKSTGAQGERLKQGCNINKSLTVLGNVINSLAQKQSKRKHVPFRDSKLTFFLKDSLGGSSVTRLLACINPSEKYITQTLSTLKFAKRAKILRLRAIQNQVTGMSVQTLRAQLKKLKEELVDAKTTILELKSVNFNKREDTLTLSSRRIDREDLNIQASQQILNRLQILQKNQNNLRALLVLRSKEQKSQIFRKIDQICKNIPNFSKLFAQNLKLKEQLKHFEAQAVQSQKIRDLLMSDNTMLRSRLYYQQPAEYEFKSNVLSDENSKLIQQVNQQKKALTRLSQQNERINQNLQSALQEIEHYKIMLDQLLQKNDSLVFANQHLLSQLQDQIQEQEFHRNQLLSLQTNLMALQPAEIEAADLIPSTHLKLSNLSLECSEKGIACQLHSQETKSCQTQTLGLSLQQEQLYQTLVTDLRQIATCISQSCQTETIRLDLQQEQLIQTPVTDLRQISTQSCQTQTMGRGLQLEEFLQTRIIDLRQFSHCDCQAGGHSELSQIVILGCEHVALLMGDQTSQTQLQTSSKATQQQLQTANTSTQTKNEPCLEQLQLQQTVLVRQSEQKQVQIELLIEQTQCQTDQSQSLSDQVLNLIQLTYLNVSMAIQTIPSLLEEAQMESFQIQGSYPVALVDQTTDQLQISGNDSQLLDQQAEKIKQLEQQNQFLRSDLQELRIEQMNHLKSEREAFKQKVQGDVGEMKAQRELSEQISNLKLLLDCNQKNIQNQQMRNRKLLDDNKKLKQKINLLKGKDRTASVTSEIS